jgi:hypothetical protein
MREVDGRLVLRGAGVSFADLSTDSDSSIRRYSRRFNQSEEFLLEFDCPYEVPPLPIHHDVHQIDPSLPYRAAVEAVMGQIGGSIIELLTGLECVFDPTHASWSIFYQIIEYNNTTILFLVTIDLSYRPSEHEVIEKGSNDIAPRYRTRNLYVNVDLVPLIDVEQNETGLLVQIERSISQTWIGETGRGYMTQGIWIDRDLNRFFTRLFVPAGVRIYPWFPFHAKFRGLCHSPVDLRTADRTTAAHLLAKARSVILPRMDEVLEQLRSQPFSEDLPLFREMKQSVDDSWSQHFRGIRMKPYLNDRSVKEYLVEIQ